MCGGPVGDVLDTTSSVLGTDGGGGGILGAAEDVGQSISSGLADIDPGPAIGSGLADVDDFVNREIPGGWTTVGGAAVLGTGLYFAPEIMAALGPEVAASTSSFTPEMIAYANASADPIMAINAISGMTPAEFALATNAAGAGVGSALMGPTYGELGITGVEGGLAGPTYGELGVTGLETGSVGAGSAPVYDFSQEVILSPEGNYIPANTLPSEIAGLDAEILKAGEAAIKAAPVSISPFQAIQGLRMASGLLGGQQGTPAGATAQFRGNTMPQGAVDYSGILNLLQTRSPQRNPYSLLG